MSAGTGARPRNFAPDASIVLVGCRGAGKRSLGFMGALHLRRRLVTEDHNFEKQTGMSKGAYLRENGSEAFSIKSLEVFKYMLDSNRSRCIIECGLSSLTEDAQDCLRQYSQTNPVVYIHREPEHVLGSLDPADAEAILRADATHRTCSNLEYFNLYDGSSGDVMSPSADVVPHQAAPARLFYARDDFANFLDCITGERSARQWLESPFSIQAIAPEYRQYSYSMRLRLSYLVDMELEWEDFEARGDCVELIIDHWPDDMFNIIAKQVAYIRRKLGVPIIYHVEENPRGERRRDPEERDRMDSELLELGLRLGVDYLSVDLGRKPEFYMPLLERRGRAKIIGNYWNMRIHTPQWSDECQMENYKQAQRLGCDIVRMCRFCAGDSPYERLDAFRDRVQTTIPDPKPPLVAYDFSVLGVRTPLQSRILSPVKHPDMENERDHLATVSTPNNAFELLFRSFFLDPLQFYTLGANVSYSLSPAMHHAAYEFSGMPHTFQAVPCSRLDELNQICSSESFGGASLTAPFKVAIMPHLRIKSHHATAIGAVNVLLPLRGRTNFILDHANSRNRAGPARQFFGDNTDWSAIATALRRAISPRNYVQPSRTTGLVIGAGGMARAAIYAMLRLGCRNIFLFNRTAEHAEAVAAHFNAWAAAQKMVADAAATPVCRVIPSLAEYWPAKFQPPTMIVSCVPAAGADGGPAADFELPMPWLMSPTGGVVVELAYEPLITPLVAQMRAFRDKVAPSWVVVDGLEVVSEMAIEAFELMTGRPAPKRLMREVCRRTWEQHQREISNMS